MALVHDGASMVAEEDRISNLPIDIIHHILSFLDMKYAIRTCKLSRKWKCIWTLMPHLNLDTRSFRTVPQFANFVKHVLSHRNSQTEVSAADLTFTGKATQFVVKSIVNYIYLHKVTRLNVTWVVSQDFEFPQCLFSSHTLKHLTLATKKSAPYYRPLWVLLPKSDWDFPALETINLKNIRLTDDHFSKCVNLKDITLDQCSLSEMDIFNVCSPQLSNLTITKPLHPKVFNGVALQLLKTINLSNIGLTDDLFSKCVNLKEITLHKCSMFGLDIIEVCAPQLSNLTITKPLEYPKVLKVVAPQLKNLTASVFDSKYSALQLSTEGSLAGVQRAAPQLLDLFQKLRSAKFLILNFNIIQMLSSSPDQLLHEPCPFDKLKSVKIDTVSFGVKKFMATIPIFKSYLLESSPSATFLVDLPQKVPQKRWRRYVDEETMSKKIAKLEEENQQLKIIAEEKRNLEAKMHMQDEFISQKQKMLEATKLQYQKLMSNIINSKMVELQVLVEGGDPNYELIRSMGRDIKSIIDLAPNGLREAFKAEISSRFEEVRSLRFACLGVCHWAEIEKELGC